MPINASDRAWFVYDPEHKRWLDPWEAARRLNMPGIPKRWRALLTVSHEYRTYELTTKEGGGVAHWVRFRVDEAGWTVEDRADVMWARAYMDLNLHGKRLEVYNPRRRREPDRKFPNGLCWRVHEIGLRDALVSLPEERDHTFAVLKSHLEFLPAEPTLIERRLQEIRLLNDQVPDGHPLRYADYLTEHGRRERPLIGAGDQVYIYRPMEEWERARENNGLTADEAIVALQVALGRMPNDGPADDQYPFNRAALQLWHDGAWTERDEEAMRRMAPLITLQRDLVETAMRSIDEYKRFLSHGGSFTLPAVAPAEGE